MRVPKNSKLKGSQASLSLIIFICRVRLYGNEGNVLFITDILPDQDMSRHRNKGKMHTR